MRRLVLVVILFVLVVVMALPATAAAAYSNIPAEVDVSIVVNGNVISPERQPVSVVGRILSPARTTFESLGATIDWYPETQTIVIIKGNMAIGMKVGSKEVNINGIITTTDAAPILVRGTVMLPVRFVADTLNEEVKWDGGSRTVYIGKNGRKITSRSSDILRSWNRTPVVVIDAGHGGRLPGAVYGRVKEADLNLDIAKRLDKLLREQGVKTYMTRDGDYHVGLYTRAALANRVNADLFVSIHNNAGNSKTSGSMTLYYNGCGNFSGRDFAEIIQRELVNTLESRNLGIYSRPNLVVLRKTRMPAVIAEVAYMTNSSDMAKLKSQSFRQNAAEAIKNGIIKALEGK